jgi:hypothetical protein
MRPSIAIPTLLAASVAVPYAATNAPQWARQYTAMPAEGASSATPPGSSIPGASSWNNATAPAPFAAKPLAEAPLRRSTRPTDRIDPRPVGTPIEGFRATSIAEILRFDVTKEWVYQRWARKSTALSELDLFGIRVPLVSGTQLSDLAGSLTYFFDAQGRVQRISFHGRTADTSQIVALAERQFGMTRQATPVVGEQLFQLRRGEDVLSELRTRPAPVLWASSLHDSFAVDLELQDPATARPLKPILPPLPKPATAAANPSAAGDAAGKSSAQKSAQSDAAKSESSGEGWKTWFPRSRASRSQIEQLDATNLSR